AANKLTSEPGFHATSAPPKDREVTAGRLTHACSHAYYCGTMALPSAYLTSFKNVDAILAAIQAAQAPPRFTQKFLEGLGFANANDRLFINILKAIGFLNET